MKTKVLGVICIIAATTFAGPLNANDAEVALAGDFIGLSYAINTRSDVFLYAAVRDVGGQVAVCGTVWTENATNTAKRLERQVARKIKFSVAGQRLRVNTDEFNRYETREEAEAGLAGCSATNTAWQAGFATQPLEATLAPGTIRN
jgi:hypothetical protein